MEVSIVSVLREIIVRGVLETSSTQILSACALLIVLGALLVIRVWLPPTFEGIDPEKRMSQKRHQERERNIETIASPLHSTSSNIGDRQC